MHVLFNRDRVDAGNVQILAHANTELNVYCGQITMSSQLLHIIHNTVQSQTVQIYDLQAFALHSASLVASH